MMKIVIAGENVCDLCHNWHDVHVFVAFGFVCPINWMHFLSKDTIQDFVCSLSTRFIQQVLTRLLVKHHLEMMSQLKSLKWHVNRASNMDLVCLLVPNYFTRHVPRHHIMDSSLHFWYLFQHWAYLGFYPSWHVINSTFITILTREAYLMLCFKGFWHFWGRRKHL